MLELKAEPLTAEAFAPFGDVIDARTSESFPINAGRTQRHHDLAKVETLGDNPRTLLMSSLANRSRCHWNWRF